MKKILITGASGFIGGFIVEKAISRGYEVFAVVRKSSSKQFLQNPTIKFLELSLYDKGKLTSELKALKDDHGLFDYVIHNAGITKANKRQQFFDVNTQITNNLADAVKETELVDKKFIFISSLAAAGPGNEDNLKPIAIDQNPHPVTAYGESKLAAEEYLKTLQGLPYLILRPTAVFGPRDTELLSLFQVVNKGFELYIGTDEQNLSFIYVEDLTEAVLTAMESPQVNKTYYISDGKRYLIKEYVAQIKAALSKRTLKFKVPVGLVAVAAFLLEKLLGVIGKVPALNSEKMAELTSKNWVCDMEPFFNDINFTPKYDLQTAVAETAEWYKKNNWI
ncbi:MAG: SDR family NAD(P)-dependent oxidoreductase [Cyclobacteriaceae bacterium]